MGAEIAVRKGQDGGGLLGGGSLALVPYRVVSLSLVRSDGAPLLVNEWSLREALGPLLKRACGKGPADEADVRLTWTPDLDRRNKGEPIGRVSITMWRGDADLVPRIVERVQKSEIRVEGGVKLLVSASEEDPHSLESFEKQWESQATGKPGARPDTLCIRGVPSRWLAEQRVSTKQPSLLVAHSVFSPLGAIKHIEISPASTTASAPESASAKGPGARGLGLGSVAGAGRGGRGTGAGGGAGAGAGAGGSILGLKLLERLKLNSDVAIQFEDHDEFLKAHKALSNRAMAQADSGGKGEGPDGGGGGKGLVRYGLEWLGRDYFEERNVRRRRFEREAEVKEEKMRKEREEEGRRRRQREAEEAERRKREEEERARKEAEEEEERRRKEEEEERLRREEEERLRREAEEEEEARRIAEEEERLREEEEERQRMLEEEEERARRQREEEEEKRRVEEEVLLRLQEQVKRAAAAASAREEEGRRGGGREGRRGGEEERERRGDRGYGERREREDGDREERGGDWRREYRGGRDAPYGYGDRERGDKERGDRERGERGGNSEEEYRGRERDTDREGGGRRGELTPEDDEWGAPGEKGARKRGREAERDMEGDGEGGGYSRGPWGRGDLEERNPKTGATDRTQDTAQDRAQGRLQGRLQGLSADAEGSYPTHKRRRLRSIIVVPDGDSLSLGVAEEAEGGSEDDGERGEDGAPKLSRSGTGLGSETAHEGEGEGEGEGGEEKRGQRREDGVAREPAAAKTKAEEIRLRNELLKRFPPKAGKARQDG